MELGVTILELEARSYEVDVALELKPVTYMNWIQEVAWVASANAGCTVSWFMANHMIPVFGTLRFDKVHPIQYTDRIVARAWFAWMRGAETDLNFELRRVRDGELVLYGHVETILLDARTGKPRDWGELAQQFFPNGKSVYDDRQPPAVTPVSDGASFQANFPVQVAEIDMARHVNNGFYVRWMTDALYNFLQPRLGSAANETSLHSVLLRYGSPIGYGREVTVSGQLTGLGEGFSQWSFEVGAAGSRRPATAEIAVRWSPEWTARLSGQGPASPAPPATP